MVKNIALSEDTIANIEARDFRADICDDACDIVGENGRVGVIEEKANFLDLLIVRVDYERSLEGVV